MYKHLYMGNGALKTIRESFEGLTNKVKEVTPDSLKEIVKSNANLVLLLAMMSSALTSCVETDNSSDTDFIENDTVSSASPVDNDNQCEELNSDIRIVEYGFNTAEFFAMVEFENLDFVEATLTFTDSEGNLTEGTVPRTYILTTADNFIHETGENLPTDAEQVVLAFHNETGQQVSKQTIPKYVPTGGPPRPGN